jgi:hypothetical protein
VLAWCQATGYAALYLAEGAWLESPDRIAGRGRCHLLLQPAAWPYPDWLKGIKQSDRLEAAMATFDAGDLK